jgi:hypothetical protein
MPEFKKAISQVLKSENGTKTWPTAKTVEQESSQDMAAEPDAKLKPVNDGVPELEDAVNTLCGQEHEYENVNSSLTNPNRELEHLLQDKPRQ